MSGPCRGRGTTGRPSSYRRRFASIQPTRRQLLLLSWCCGQRVVYNWSEDTTSRRNRRHLRLAREAAALSSDDAFVLAVLGSGLVDCLASFDGPRAGAWRGPWRSIPTRRLRGPGAAGYRNVPGRPRKLPSCTSRRALRLSPFEPDGVRTASWGSGAAHFVAGRYEQAGRVAGESAFDAHPAATWMLSRPGPRPRFCRAPGQGEGKVSTNCCALILI